MPRKTTKRTGAKRRTGTQRDEAAQPQDERDDVAAALDESPADTEAPRARRSRSAGKGRRAADEGVRDAEPVDEADDEDLDLDEELEDEFADEEARRGQHGRERGRRGFGGMGGVWGAFKGRWQDWVLDHLRDPTKAAKLLRQVRDKIDGLRQDASADTWKYLQAIQRLVAAWSAGEYREIPIGSLVMIVGAVIYFVSPIDILPDFLPMIGLKDDAAVIAVVLAFVRADLDRFLEWERHQKQAKGAGTAGRTGRARR